MPKISFEPHHSSSEATSGLIDVQAQRISQQGYVASVGKYLLYPAILHTNEGTTTLVFTITSTTLNPSAAYAVLKSDATRFSGIKMSAIGAGAHKSFAFHVTGRTRWGDYSVAALDPSGNNIWQATEYIPPAANQGPLDNWGTRVSEVAGDHSSRGYSQGKIGAANLFSMKTLCLC